MKTLTTHINSETEYRFAMLAKRAGMTTSQALREIATNGKAIFLAKIGGVHQGE